MPAEAKCWAVIYLPVPYFHSEAVEHGTSTMRQQQTRGASQVLAPFHELMRPRHRCRRFRGDARRQSLYSAARISHGDCSMMMLTRKSDFADELSRAASARRNEKSSRLRRLATAASYQRLHEARRILPLNLLSMPGACAMPTLSMRRHEHRPLSGTTTRLASNSGAKPLFRHRSTTKAILLNTIETVGERRNDGVAHLFPRDSSCPDEGARSGMFRFPSMSHLPSSGGGNLAKPPPSI